MSNSKKRIAVLGGGPASMAAVYEMTSKPGWNEQFDITVHQMGWRLGGKCASGRGSVAGETQPRKTVVDCDREACRSLVRVELRKGM